MTSHSNSEVGSTETRKHTPGPWHLFPKNPLCIEARDGNVALVNLARSSEADARLIAAAPDLLALARQYASECARCGGSAEIVVNDHGDDPEWDHCQPCNECEDIWAVINKAEGKS